MGRVGAHFPGDKCCSLRGNASPGALLRAEAATARPCSAENRNARRCIAPGSRLIRKSNPRSARNRLLWAILTSTINPDDTPVSFEHRRKLPGEYFRIAPRRAGSSRVILRPRLHSFPWSPVQESLPPRGGTAPSG